MKSYLSFVPISSRVHKRQNRMTTLCIIFTVFLVTSIFSMADMIIKQETTNLIAQHGEAEVQAFFKRPGVMTLYPAALILFIFILFAGVLMISSSMNSSVSQRVKIFGMMRCIGMSKKQIIRTVRLEALYLCKTAIPIGLVLGMGATWSFCGILKFGIGGEWANMPQFGISIIGIISCVMDAVITVLLAAKKPANRAAKVSPMEAIRGGNDISGNKKVAAVFNKLKIEKILGIGHALESKRNLLLQAGSIALSIILFLSFSVFVELVNSVMPPTPSIVIMAENASNTLSYDTILKIKGMDSVRETTARRSVFEIPVTSGERDEIQRVDIISLDESDIRDLVKNGFLDKKVELKKVFGSSEYCLIISDQIINEGTEINIFSESLKVVGNLSYDPFSNDGSISEQTTLIVSNETFTNVLGIKDYSYLTIDLKKSATDEDVENIRTLIGNGYSFNDQREHDNSGTYIAFLCCIYGFLAIIALVSLLNIVNNISMGVQARMKQYGAMRAVGMGSGQLVRMIASEAVMYGITGCLLGLAIGIAFSRWMFGYLITSHFAYVRWSFPVGQLLIILVFVSVAVLFGVVIPSKHIKRMTITDTINEL